jgi:uncharacterized protein (TIGR00369 family)
VDDAAPLDYPPARHLLRDLRLEVEHRPDGTSRAWMPVVPALLDDGGGVRAGALATLVDVVGGGLAAHAARPDWIATADLTLHLVSAVPDDAVEARGRVLRRGRTTVVLEVGLAGAHGDTLGIATMTFSVLARRDSNPVLEAPDGDTARMSLSVDGSGFRRPFVDALGLQVADGAPGAVLLTPTPYVRNSFGAVQGGVMATLVESSAREALRDACGAPVESVDLQLTYVALGRTGPIRATAEVLSAGPAFGTARVELLDDGDARLTTVGRVVAALPGGVAR